MIIRPASPEDAVAIWRIVEPVIRAGETYALERDMSETAALRYWMGDDKTTFVAEEENQVVGTYYIRRNQAGGGSHLVQQYAVLLAAPEGVHSVGFCHTGVDPSYKLGDLPLAG